MVSIVNCFLPEKTHCRLSFLQDILCDKKKVYTKEQVQDRVISKNYEEYALKNVYPLVRNSRLL